MGRVRPRPDRPAAGAAERTPILADPTGPQAAAPPRLVFMHIPKTGGTSLHHLLQPAFTAEETCPTRFAELYRYSDAELGRWRFFSGHFRMDEIRRIPPPAYRMTLLRDPVERIVSLWRFWRRIGFSFPAPAPGPAAARAAPDLASFLRSTAPEVANAVDNAMARELVGLIFPRPGGWMIADRAGRERPITPAETLSGAREALMGFALVGFTEAGLGAAHAAVAADLGLAPPATPEPPRLNTAEEARADLVGPEPRPALTEADRAELDRVTVLDRAVHAFARGLLRPGEAVARPLAQARGVPGAGRSPEGPA